MDKNNKLKKVKRAENNKSPMKIEQNPEANNSQFVVIGLLILDLRQNKTLEQQRTEI